ncbi:MAG TPA: F0F1 ATP synthase subunit A [Fredinandcohnia sp.]|nr:F0F1 ATP synthase subunit A [Fredinandcohnia sp.]
MLALSLAAFGLAAPVSASAAGDTVPDAVIHHVVDGNDLSFQNPFTGSTYTILLPEIKVSLGSYELDLSITRHLVIMWVAAAILVLVISLAARKRRLVPRGFYSMVEVIVSFIRDELAVKNIGKEEADRWVPFLATVFFFIFTLNLFGLLPYSATATGNISVTAGLALITFALTQYAGMRSQGVFGYWAGIVPHGVPVWLYPIMLPVELLGLLTKPFALAVRLFANMTAGGFVIYFLIGLIFMLGESLAPVVAPVSVAFATAMFLLKMFVALLQAYIFTMLSALFIGMAAHPH